MSTRYHKKYNKSIIDGSPYLKRNIFQKEGSETQFKCVPCQKSFNTKEIYFENLAAHMKSRSHQKTAIIEIHQEELSAAIKYLEENDKPIKGSKSPMLEEDILPKDGELGRNQEGLTLATAPSSIMDRLGANVHYKFLVTGFIVENNLPFSLVEKLSTLWKDLQKKLTPEVSWPYTVSDLDVTTIVSGCIGKSLKEKYLRILETSHFSIAMDEGTDKGNISYLAMNARFFAHKETNETTTKFLGLVNVGESSTGESLYQLVNSFLFSGSGGEARRTNFMGISTDHASNMISRRDAGVTNRLQREFSYIVVVHDICHALNLVLKHIIDILPSPYMNIIKDIATTFSQSPQKAAKFTKYLRKEEAKEDKEDKEDEKKEQTLKSIKRYVPTRWSSLQECLERILDPEVSKALKRFFEEEGTSEQKKYFDPENVIILQLILCIINKVNSFIKYFQKEDLEISEIIDTFKNCALTFADYIYPLTNRNETEITSHFLMIEPLLLNTESIEDLIPKNVEEFEEFFLKQNPQFQKPYEVKTKSAEFQELFFKTAKSLFEKTFEQIKSRLPWKEEVWKLIECFYLPKNKKKESLDSLRRLGKRFKNIIRPADEGRFNNEVENLSYRYETMRRVIKHTPGGYLEAWKSNSEAYPRIYCLVRALQTLPYSTASIERNFSTMKDVKTIKRNRLSRENLEACLLAKQEFKDDAISFSEEMISKYEQIIKPKPKLITKITSGRHDAKTDQEPERLSSRRSEIFESNVMLEELKDTESGGLSERRNTIGNLDDSQSLYKAFHEFKKFYPVFLATTNEKQPRNRSFDEEYLSSMKPKKQMKNMEEAGEEGKKIGDESQYSHIYNRSSILTKMEEEISKEDANDENSQSNFEEETYR